MDSVRERIAQAVTDEIAERGYENASVEGVIDRAGVTMAEFLVNFEDLADCAIRVYRQRIEEFTDQIVSAFEAEEVWPDSLRAAAYATADFLHANPSMLEFGTTQMFSSGLISEARRESQFKRMVEMIDAGREAPGVLPGVNRSTADVALGTIYETIIRNTGDTHETSKPETYVPDLMYVTVRLYLGEEAARRELELPPPPRYQDPG
jgi:AcrR family transcriptional regulator